MNRRDQRWAGNLWVNGYGQRAEMLRNRDGGGDARRGRTPAPRLEC